MGMILKFERKEIPFFGGCPVCKKNDGILNIGRDHWCFCDAHKTRWLIGGNLFSGWRSETEEEWRKNQEKLACYREVEPVFGAVYKSRPTLDDDDNDVPF